MRLPVLIVSVLLVAGCNSPPSSYDPFLGRTTVPPPGTMQTPPPGTVQPYYQGSPPTGVMPAPSSSMVPAPGVVPSSPPGSPPPPGAYGVPQSSLNGTGSVRPGSDGRVAAAAPRTGSSPAIQILRSGERDATLTGGASGSAAASGSEQGASEVAASTGPSGEPGWFSAPNEVRAIADEPPARTAAEQTPAQDRPQ